MEPYLFTVFIPFVDRRSFTSLLRLSEKYFFQWRLTCCTFFTRLCEKVITRAWRLGVFPKRSQTRPRITIEEAPFRWTVFCVTKKQKNSELRTYHSCLVTNERDGRQRTNGLQWLLYSIFAIIPSFNNNLTTRGAVWRGVAIPKAEAVAAKIAKSVMARNDFILLMGSILSVMMV